MDVSIITLLLFSSIVFGLLTGTPLVFVLGGVAVTFSYFEIGPQSLMMIPYTALGVMDNFILISLPLFIYMGIILQHSGIAKSLYDMIYMWIGEIRGGLAIGTVVICTIFAAMSGISAAATVSMGVIALPSMLKYSYQKEIAIGCISAGGSLGILIPPSVLMIVYGVFSRESIGALFAGGVIPGIILSSMFIAYIAIRCHLNPSIGPSIPRDERKSLREKLFALRQVILPVFLIASVLGTMFAGIATPTEAAAIGAIGALVCTLVSRSFTWQMFKSSAFEAMGLSCMIVWIIIGGSCLTAVYTAVGALDFIREFVSLLPVSRYLVLIGMQLCLFFLGMLLDPGAIIMICTPVFVPVIKSLGFDPVWFGVIFIINMEMGYLTPPFGFNLFYMKSIVPPSVSMMDIYKSVTPFVVIQGLCILLLILFPQLALWLPSLIIK